MLSKPIKVGKAGISPRGLHERLTIAFVVQTREHLSDHRIVCAAMITEENDLTF